MTAILFQLGTELGDTSNIAWIPGGWSIASSVSFSIAGSLSDIFGRRYVTLSGQAFAVVGAVSILHRDSGIMTKRLISMYTDCGCHRTDNDNCCRSLHLAWFCNWYHFCGIRWYP